MKDLISNKWKYKTKEAKLILHSGIYIYIFITVKDARPLLWMQISTTESGTG